MGSWQLWDDIMPNFRLTDCMPLRARGMMPRSGGRRALVVSGGVACNGSVRSALQEVADGGRLRLVVPPPALCTDNGAMIAWAGQEVRGFSASPGGPHSAGSRCSQTSCFRPLCGRVRNGITYQQCAPHRPLPPHHPAPSWTSSNGDSFTVQRLDAHFAYHGRQRSRGSLSFSTAGERARACWEADADTSPSGGRRRGWRWGWGCRRPPWSSWRTTPCCSRRAAGGCSCAHGGPSRTTATRAQCTSASHPLLLPSEQLRMRQRLGGHCQE